MFALNPELELAGGIASVFAAFVHRDDDGLDGDWRG
jgi:hypothetical protein